MSKCPVCDTENAPGLTVCDFCGAELPETKKCKACGAEIPKKASYCPICRNLADVKPASTVGGGVASGVSKYCVSLDSIGDDRQEVIKVVRELCNCSFDEARSIIDGDGVILDEVSKLEAEIAISKLRGAGARASMEEVGDYSSGSSSSNYQGSHTPRYSSSSSSSSSSARFVDTPMYGLLAIISSIFLGWIGLIICLYGFFKTGDEDVKKKCKIGLFILAGLVVVGIIIAIIAGSAAASAAGSYY